MAFDAEAWARMAGRWRTFLAARAPVTLVRVAPAGADVVLTAVTQSASPKLTESGVVVFDTLTGWAAERLQIGESFTYDSQQWRVSDTSYNLADGASDVPHRYVLLGRARGPKEGHRA